MRGLISAGLGLMLACLAAHSSAEEVEFRPAGQAAPAKPGLIPTTYNQDTSEGGPLWRAKFDTTKSQQLPGGPPLEGTEPPKVDAEKAETGKTDKPKTETPKPEQMPTPKPLPAGAGPAYTGSGFVGHVPQGTMIYEVPPGSAVPGVGVVTSDVCCEPDWCCGRGRKGWWHCWSGPDANCCLPNFYARGEYLLWCMSNPNLPPLVTSTTLTPAQIVALSADPTFRPGALGQPGTNLLFGGSDIDSPTFSGGRFTLGFGNVIGQNVGFETTFFFLGDSSLQFAAASDPTGQPGLYSPFFDGNGNPQSLFVAFPTLLQGNVAVEHSSRMWGIEANFRKPWICDCSHRLDLLLGFRFVELNESLSINRFSVCLPPQAPCTSQVDDLFGTRNRFYGGQIGLEYEYRHCNWNFGVWGKVALGSMYERILITGSSTLTEFTAGGAPVVTRTNTGLLAQNSNSGAHTQDRFAVVPELGFKIGYQLTDNINAYVGYSFLYLSDVVRPGDQVDLIIDQTGALRRPAVPFRTTDFWAHGLNFGLACRY